MSIFCFAFNTHSISFFAYRIKEFITFQASKSYHWLSLDRSPISKPFSSSIRAKTSLS
jgi:cellulose synthase/poly-beta-1,6-N-acetylglucosamine synthase-like glycosyltransferase